MAMTRLIATRFYLLLALCLSWWLGFAQPMNPLGNASSLGPGLCYVLTPNAAGQAGGIYSSITVNLNQPWTFTALLYFGTADAGGADGIAFVLTPNPVLG